MLAMMLELVVVCKTTQLTIFMPGLSLRGPEGSVSRAVGIMREEHEKVVRFFGAGILCFVFSAMCQCWILFGFYDKDYCVAAGGRWVEDGDLPLRPGTPRCDFVRPIPPLTPPCLTIASLCLTAPPCPNSPLARPPPGRAPPAPRLARKPFSPVAPVPSRPHRPRHRPKRRFAACAQTRALRDRKDEPHSSLALPQTPPHPTTTPWVHPRTA